MNYQITYDQIIVKAKSQLRNKLNKKDIDYIYYELHHIIPRCVKNDESKENKVLLTAKEHFICHKLLVEIYKDNQYLIDALWLMMNVKSDNQQRDYKIGSREYERCKKEFSKNISKRMSGEGNHMFNKTHEGESLQKIKDNARRQVENGTNPIVKSGKDNIMHNNSMYNIWETKYGKEEADKKLAICLDKRKQTRLKNKKVKDKIICIYCGLIGTSKSNMNRYHFDNCKHKPKDNE